jgi:hypothetical protein
MLRLGRAHRLSIAFLMVSLTCLQAGSLKKAWEVDLKKALQDEHLDSNESFKVRQVLFSPDGQQIAVMLQNSAILLRAQDPKALLGRFRVGLNDAFGWSPDSQMIHAGNHVVRLGDGKACDLPQLTLFPHFIGKQSLVAMSPPDYRTLRFFDSDCKENGSWDVRERWGIQDASAEQKLLSVSELAGSFRSLIVKPLTKQVLHSGPMQDAPSVGLPTTVEPSAVATGVGTWIPARRSRNHLWREQPALKVTFPPILIV